MALLTGNAPVSTMRNYQRDVISYTKGRGRLTLSLSGYEPCHNAEEVIAASGYDFDSRPPGPCRICLLLPRGRLRGAVG